ncbi:hypothetical protein FN846DRAFT_975897 [Sphaerosporella brunnea]|uniref:Uncharacterized protein n=1 Tax=Sphaerosporella brunnea TaxID=1250544 RepID=A0A5J5EHB5_9PEZI|nr:hypothetical protein FN846DRAFT_975897 [Sphaerosporella brunnea]
MYSSCRRSPIQSPSLFNLYFCVFLLALLRLLLSSTTTLATSCLPLTIWYLFTTTTTLADNSLHLKASAFPSKPSRSHRSASQRISAASISGSGTTALLLWAPRIGNHST